MTSVEKQFHVPPFPPFPSAERYIRVGSQDDALQRVRRAVEAWEAISLVIGPPGTGKSLISQVLQQHFARDREVILFGDATLESPQALQRHLLSRLDRIRGIAPTPPAVGDDPQLAIIERIAASSKEFAGLLLLVDEAQTLRPEVLETIRILTNVMSGGRPRVSAVLLGGPGLDETLALPSLDALVQRVATRCYLHPLSSDETVHYVREVAKRFCDSIKLDIEESAIRSIHRACSGVPRLVNQLMTASLAFASQRKQTRITDQTVDQAWAILQQLPGPLMEEPELARPGYDVEFGPLSDDESSCDDDLGMNAHDGMIEISNECISDLPGENVDEHASETDRCGQSEGGCEAPQQDATAELAMQTEIATTYNDAVQFEPMSYDCGNLGTFDYDNCLDESGSNQATAETKPCESHSTPSPDELFGEFDEEEPVSETLRGQAIPASETLAFRAHSEPDDSDDTEPHDLEASLHREILSLSGAAAAPVLWLEEGEDAGESVDDDRDLLVIEDDIEVEEAMVVGKAASDETPGTPVAVDFQSMLAKMRSPQR